MSVRSSRFFPLLGNIVITPMQVLAYPVDAIGAVYYVRLVADTGGVSARLIFVIFHYYLRLRCAL